MERSYNSWSASPDKASIGVNANAVARKTAKKFPGGVKSGDVEFLLMYLAGEIHRRVEPLGTGCWGYAYRQNRNANNLSCHASGTAIDVNAPAHPNGKRGTWSAKKKTEVREILAECGGVIRWGEDFGGTVDGMHFEIHGDAAAVKKAADALRKRLAPPKPVAKPVPKWFKRNLYVGLTGADVVECQKRLHLSPADGDFGPKTKAAVIKVQQAHGLTANGTVRPDTARVIG